MTVTVIIPTVNEEKKIVQTLERISKEKPHEIIVVDGGNDKTGVLAKKYAKVIKVEEGKKWRSILMNKGAEKAKGEWLLFLHADTMLPKNPFKNLPKNDDAAVFKVSFDHDDWFFRTTAWISNNIRLRRGIVFGDHGLFVKRKLFEKMRGFKEVGIFEDVEFSKRLRRETNIVILKICVCTSARRYIKRGRLKQFLINQIVKVLWFLGVDDITIRKVYRGIFR